MNTKHPLRAPAREVVADIARALGARSLITTDPTAKTVLDLNSSAVRIAFGKHFKKAEVEKVWTAAYRAPAEEIAASLDHRNGTRSRKTDAWGVRREGSTA